ncbi:hypothetical protein G6F46_006539 [Rhizopus delemar]|uniref:Uncharacterized protein n=3 Tax=Rhizopus TaxID=4842 RepID=I1BNV1_RHIO9|nr:hypothetical protein RO3G_02585 [Rhizopus delemar RA 99-880]KAG1458780.1 hypothetical protein G6F55_005151 [Rhizopus delemar]KAG1543423.1 hypothetical protein G6F51_006687 [Rhizopus arrhizus]KAG1497604.1 hypothetical protein G6F54_005655 [Rhizopus delemar]KAG1511065.1 hypothetical protein G6F53_006220 [Rhizopus delemar]|eukprot:EIE77881.1 hypothetical protein RO3G_02585 [Rhizopus delemar RA 99-880]
MPNEQERLPRWQFRKQKKLEKRSKKRKEIAESREVPKEIENQKGEEYEQQKAQWEANEVKHKVIELARLKAIEKEEESRKIAQKKWQEILLSLPLSPNSNKFTLKKSKKESNLKIFVPSSEAEPKRRTYRDRFLEQKAKKNAF